MLPPDPPPQPFRPEIIYVNKVYNECSMVDCITLRVPVPPCFPPAVNVVDCAVTDLVAEGFVVGTNEIDVDVTFTLNIEYDSNGNSQFIQQAGQFRRRGPSPCRCRARHAGRYTALGSLHSLPCS